MRDSPSSSRTISTLLLGLALLVVAAGSGRAAEPVRIGAYRTSLRGLLDPAAVAVASDGTIAVAEAGANHVRLFDAAGTPQRVVGRLGDDPGDLLDPRGVAFFDDGVLAVADTGNHRIQLFKPDGSLLRGWGERGTGAGQLASPHGLAIRGDDLYVADTGNNRVQVFSRDGAFARVIGGFGRGPGRFNRPVAVAVDAAGVLHVSDADNNRVQSFGPNGEPLATWGAFGPYPGLLDAPGGVVTWAGEIFVADTRNHRIQISDGSGGTRGQWGEHALTPHAGEGLIHYPSDLAFAPGGDFMVLCESFEDRCQLFDLVPAPKDDAQTQPALVSPKAISSHFGEHLAVSERLIAIAEPENYRVHLFEGSRDIPIVIGDFGERGARYGQSVRAAGIALDLSRRRLYTSDLATRRLQSFNVDYDPDAPRGFDPNRFRLRRAIDIPAALESAGAPPSAWPVEPAALAVTPDGRLLVLDRRNAVVHVFTDEFEYRGTWGGYGTEPGRFRGPTDLALGGDGRTIYVVDALNHRIQVLDLDGTPRRAWGSPGDGPDQFGRPFGVTVVGERVFVTDSVRDRVLGFDGDGNYLHGWGERGDAHGQFWTPRGIVHDHRGRLVVVDHGNHRLQVFWPDDGAWLVTFGLGRAWTRWDGQPRRGGGDEGGGPP